MTLGRLLFLAVFACPLTVAAQTRFPLNYVVDVSGVWRVNGLQSAPLAEHELLSPSMTIEHDAKSGAPSDSLRLRLNGRLLVVSCARGGCTRPITIPAPLGALGGSITVSRMRQGLDSIEMLRRVRHHASLSADFKINNGIVTLRNGSGDLGPLLDVAAPRGLVAVLCEHNVPVCVPESESAIVVPLRNRTGAIELARPGLYDAHIFRVRVTTDGERYESTSLRGALVLVANEVRGREVQRELDALFALVAAWKDPALPKEREQLRLRYLQFTDPR